MYVEIFMCNLLENQLRSYYLDNRIRIDFNLNDFVVKDNILYLVDVMPPIFIDRVVEEKSKRYNRKIAQLIELYTNINYQIISIIGYWGIWFTTCATYVTTAIICCIRYFTGKWKDKVIK